MTIAEKMEWDICSEDAHAFIFGLRMKDQTRQSFLFTKNEHDVHNPVQPFPDSLHLRAILDSFLVTGGIIEPKNAKYAQQWGFPFEHLEAMHDSHIIAVEKSRQMMITWIVLAYLLWRAKFREHQLILVQSKREDDAKTLTCVKDAEPDAARLTFMEAHLPDHLKSIDFSRKGSATKCNIFFPSGSHVWGIPEGAGIIRGNTPSVLFSDEAAFQPAFGEAYSATLPAVHGGGQLICVSTAEVGEFQHLVEADDEAVYDDAMAVRITDSGVPVIRLHYSADPKKDPATETGKEWLRRELNGYVGGTESSKWQREMEIVYSAGGGDKVFPQFSLWRHQSAIFVESHDVSIEGARLWASYDHGFVNPACYLVHAVYPDGLKRTIWECYGSGIHVPQMAEIIKGNSVTLADGRRFQGNPYAGKEIQKICDPEIDRRTQVGSIKEAKRVIELFRKYGVYFIKGESGDDATVADWLLGNLWADPMAPKYQISTSCVNLIWELGRLQRKRRTTLMLRKQNELETLVDRDNHAWDSLKYFLKRFPVTGVSKPAKNVGNTFDYWKSLIKTPDSAKKTFKASYQRQGVR